MKIHEIIMHQDFDIPVEQLWEAFNDHVSFGKIMGLHVERIADSGTPGNVNGTGSVRRIKIPAGSLEETVMKSEKPKLIEYKITRGTPLHHHYGIIKFNDPGGGRSAIDYSISLGSKFPFIGGIIKGVLQKGMSASLRKYAAKLQTAKK